MFKSYTVHLRWGNEFNNRNWHTLDLEFMRLLLVGGMKEMSTWL